MALSPLLGPQGSGGSGSQNVQGDSRPVRNFPVRDADTCPFLPPAFPFAKAFLKPQGLSLSVGGWGWGEILSSSSQQMNVYLLINSKHAQLC